MALRSSLQPQPHQYIGDFAGRPLDNGMVYFGEPDKDPEFYPINIYSDSDLSTPLSQPVRTKGGFMYDSGKMTEVYASQYAYSVKVVNNYGAMVFYEPRMERVSIKDSIEINTKLDVAGSVTRTQGDKNSESISLLDFIPPSEMAAIKNRTSSYDCSAALAAAVATGKRVTIPQSGTYKFIDGYSGTTDFDVVATTAGVTFDLSDVTKSTSIENSGSLTKLLTATNPVIKKGSRSIDTVISGVVAGDWICFYNPSDFSYSASKASYRAGEWRKVAAVTADKTIFTQGFYEDYELNTLDVYKLNSVKCAIENIKLVQKNKKAGVIKFSLSSDAQDKNITFDVAASATITYDRCVGHESHKPIGTNIGITVGTNNGLEYGIVVSNSQHGRVFNANIYSQRHAITTGGGVAECSVPVSDFRCYDSVLSNEEGINIGCADMHPNTRHSSYERTTVNGGTKVSGGDECYFIGCKIYTDTNGVAGNFTRSMGGRSGWIDCEVFGRGSPQDNSGQSAFIAGGVANAFYSDTRRPTEIVLNKITYTNPDIVTAGYESFVKVKNSGSPHKININIDDITINTPVRHKYLLSINSDAGSTSSDYIICDNIKGVIPENLVASSTVGYVESPLRLPRVAIAKELTTTASLFLRETPNYLPFTFPRPPSVTVTVREKTATLQTTQVGIAGQVDYEIKTVQANLSRVQSQIVADAPFTANIPVILSTTVEIREC